MSEDTRNVYQRLNDARKEFHGLKLTKTGESKFAGYKYFELGDFLLPAMEVLTKHGLCPLPISFTADLASMTIVAAATPAEAIVFTSPMGSAALKGCHEVQNIGAVETYQRRYLWCAAMEIVEHDALDATAGKTDSVDTVHRIAGEGTPPPAKAKMSGPHNTVAALKEAINEIRETCETAPDKDSLDSYLDTQRDTMMQVKRDKPGWWDNPDYGLDGIIKAAYERIELEADELHARGENLVDMVRAG